MNPYDSSKFRGRLLDDSLKKDLTDHVKEYLFKEAYFSEFQAQGLAYVLVDVVFRSNTGYQSLALKEKRREYLRSLAKSVRNLWIAIRSHLR